MVESTSFLSPPGAHYSEREIAFSQFGLFLDEPKSFEVCEGDPILPKISENDQRSSHVFQGQLTTVRR